MTLESALRRLEYRPEQLARMVSLGVPLIVIENQRRLVSQARGWVDSPPADILD